MKTQTARPNVEETCVRLVSVDASVRPSGYVIEGELALIGSGEGCEITLPSSKIDAAHAAIVRIGSAAFVCDLGGPGGTTLDDRRVRCERLAPGSVLQVGPFAFRVESPAGGSGDWAAEVFRLCDARTIGDVANREPVMLIGSDAACDVVLPDPSIRPRHALIAWTTRGAVLRDLMGSFNVRRNGRRVRQSELAGGDRIGIGPYELMFQCDAVSAGATFGAASGAEAAAAVKSSTHGDGSMSERGSTSLADILSRMSHGEAPWPETIASSAAEPAGRRGAGAAHDGSHRAARTSDKTVSTDLGSDVTRARQWRRSVTEAGSASTGQAGAGHTGARPAGVGPAADGQRDASISAKLRTVSEQSDRLRSRVAAAQQALDERAQKLWEGLTQERERLSTYHAELQSKARRLLQTAMQKRGATGGSPSGDGSGAGVERPSEPVPPLIDQRNIDRVFGGRFEPAGATARNAEATARAASESVAGSSEITLEAQAAELARLVRAERSEVDAADARLESLRFEIERLRSQLVRGDERYGIRRRELEHRTQALQGAQQSLESEREALAARLKQIEARQAAVSGSLAEAEQGRAELEREAQQLSSARADYEARRAELRETLESERHRLQVRQAEMQRRAAELARLARERRQQIESELAVRQSDIEARERQLRAQRLAVEEASRFELDRTAGELEQVLMTRLGEIEQEIQMRQTGLTSWIESMSGEGAPATRTAERAPGGPSFGGPAIGSTRPGHVDGGVAAERGRLTELQQEIESLQDAIRGISDAATWGVTNTASGEPAGSVAVEPGQAERWPGAMKARLSEKIASLRVQVSPESRHPLEPIPLKGEQP